MANIIIDLNKFVNAQSKTLFAGRANGQRAAEQFRVSEFDKESGDTITFKIASGIVVSSSYYLGMLESILPKFSSSKEFYAHVQVDGKKYELGMMKELERAIERGLYKNESFF
ncbi:hypothetical protein RN616_11140 [Morganella morganii]|uniref:hypothetical protein n=1 Tax=Morganella morganii TaxID=582 RepID=UPI0028D7961A|nr:hypothetical protein [Morganella morganii]WNP29090.1 hypothetical protein RN616_11140 [Morganella morganii]